MIIISGDVAWSGAAEEYQAAIWLLSGLENVVVVPGNHDVVRATTTTSCSWPLPPQVELVYQAVETRPEIELGIGGLFSGSKRPPQGFEANHHQHDSDDARLLLQIGRRIAELRAAAGFTQELLALRSGLSTRYVARIETEGVNLPMQTMNQIAKALRVSVADLLVPPASMALSRPGRPSKN